MKDLENCWVVIGETIFGGKIPKKIGGKYLNHQQFNTLLFLKKVLDSWITFPETNSVLIVKAVLQEEYDHVKKVNAEQEKEWEVW